MRRARTAGGDDGGKREKSGSKRRTSKKTTKKHFNLWRTVISYDCKSRQEGLSM